MTKKQDDIDFCESYPESRRWLASYGTAKGKETAAYGLKLFCDRVKRNPTELMALHANDPKAVYRLVDDFAVNDAVPDWSRKTAVSAVRSLFHENYTDLPKKVGSDAYYPSRVKPIRTPRKETFRMFLEGCFNPRDKALVMFIGTSAVAEGSIPHLTFRNLEPDWQETHPDAPFEAYLKHLEATNLIHIRIVGQTLEDGRTTLKGGGQGKYADVEQHTFITPEAQEALMAYLRWRQRKDGLGYDAPVFIGTRPFGRALTRNGIKTIFRKIGENSPVYFSPHDFRRFVQNALEDARVHPNRCRKIRGRKVSGEVDPYSQPKIEQLKADYKDAVQYMTLKEKPVIDTRREVWETLKENPNGVLDELLKPIAKKRGVSVEFLKKNLAQSGKVKE